MPLAARHPSMSHSPVYYHNRTNVGAAPSYEYAAPSSLVQQLPSAHLHRHHRSLSPVAASPVSRQSSESGRFSRPVGAVKPRLSDIRKHSPQSTYPHTFSFSSNAEQSTTNHGLHRSAKPYSGRYDTVPSQRSSRPDRRTAESNTTIYTHTLEGGGVEMFTDHAVLVLVSRTGITRVPITDVPYSSGLHALIRSIRFSVPCTPYSPCWH
jgi:hypothetical protein